MKWTIDKQFSLCYGHRVYTQKLDSNYTARGDCNCACRHLHGHEGLIHVFLEADELTDGMVTDFKHLGWLKNFIDDVLDHKFIIDVNDPMFVDIVESLYEKYDDSGVMLMNEVCVPGTNTVVGHTIDMTNIKPGTPDYEVLEGYFLVNFVPTSENLCKWLFDLVEERMNQMNVKTKAIWWNETPKSRSIYSAD